MKTARSNRRYFVAMFGPKWASEHPVDGGCYPLPASVCPPGISGGDMVILFCTRKYPQHGWTAPGVGEVSHTKQCGDQVSVYYQYRRLVPYIDRASLMDCLDVEERKQLENGGFFKTYWLRRIKATSFECAVRGRQMEPCIDK